MKRLAGGDDDYCCDMRGMLGFLILFLLSKKPMHGQELAGRRKTQSRYHLPGTKKS